MPKPERMPMLGPTAWVNHDVLKPGPGKSRLNQDTLASLMEADLNTFLDNCTTRFMLTPAKRDAK